MAQQPYRIRVQERDFSGFVQTIVSENGAMVIDSEMGPMTPTLCQSEQDVINFYGIPNAAKWGSFEAISYARQAPIWVARAIGAGALYQGIDVIGGTVQQVVTFGKRTGRDFNTFNPASVHTDKTDVIATGDGITKTFTGSLTKTPIIESSFQLFTGTLLRDAIESGGTITGTAATGTLDISTGAYSITFTGTSGTAASYTSTIDLSAGVDLSSGGIPKAIKLTIDQTVYDNLSFGNSPTTSLASIVTAINTAVGYTAATTVSGKFVKITGRFGSSSLGQIIIAAPTDTITYATGVNIIFAPSPSVLVQNVNATDPVGIVPFAGQQVSVDYFYAQNLSTTLSHSFFALSQFNDSFFQLAAQIENTNNAYQYTMTLYQNVPNKGFTTLNTYNYSLINEKSPTGQSLYYKDVFRFNPYIQIYVNPLYVAAPVIPTNSATIVNFTGGNRGANPLNSDFLNAWNQFQNKNKYPVNTFMDIYGTQAITIRNLIQNYQPYSFGITMVPPGNNAASAVLFRQSLGIDFDGISVYTNWSTVVDPYNNSYAFISQIGAVGVKYAEMQDVFDGLPPAGIDENSHGGQLAAFQVVSMENDYTENDKTILDQAQINPIEDDPIYGPIIDGNRTLQVTNSDTSFIHTRRIYNLIIFNIINQVLRQQVFKLNDDIHRLKCKNLTEQIINPILAQNLLNDAVVVCDDSNNTAAVLDQRKFILDVYVKAAVDSEFVLLRLTRLSQTTIISEFIKQQ